ncbi:hypothetical protein KAU34_08440 [candidate division WOR-3 bacterium]|nr:hypothetical protein [candidate division WOR-3 bacterium]
MTDFSFLTIGKVIYNPFFFLIFYILHIFSVTSLAKTSTKEIVAVYTQKPPLVDGKIDDSCWKQAKKSKNFIQTYPKFSELPTNETYVYILYDTDYLYIGLKCKCSNKIAARLIQRDTNLPDDESILIILDPLFTHNEGYLFGINALGTQFDARLSNNGQMITTPWDANWESKVVQSNKGWTAEIAVPFNTFHAKNAKGDWGINFIRFNYIGAECEISMLSPSKGNLLSVSKCGLLKNIQIGSQKRVISLTPYLTYERTVLADSSKKWEVKPGADFTATLVPGIKGILTVKPDNALVEADVDQFNLERANLLWLPEKRPFFLGEINLFQSPIVLIYTRSIPDINWGAKLLGNLSGFSFNIFDVQSEATDALESQNFAVCSIKKNILNNSYLRFQTGNIFTKKNPSNGAVGTDVRIYFPKDIIIQLQGCKSWEEGIKSSKDYGYNLIVQRVANLTGFNFYGSYTGLQPNFNPRTGFLPYGNNFKEGVIQIGYKYFLNKLSIGKTEINSTFIRWEDYNGFLLNSQYQGTCGFQIKSLSFSLNYIQQKRWFYYQYYQNKIWLFTINHLTEQGSGKLNYQFGNYFGARLDYLYASYEIRFSKGLSCQAGLAYQHLTYPEETTNDIIETLNIYYKVKDRIGFKIFIQRSDISKKLQINALIEYNISVFSHIYLVWNEARDIGDLQNNDRFPPMKQRKQFFKMCYQFSF